MERGAPCTNGFLRRNLFFKKDLESAGGAVRLLLANTLDEEQTMSWFSGSALPLSLGDTLNGLKDKVQAKVNSIDPDLIKKLTLQSDELLAERQQIDDEERRKEAVRDSLSEILPWETRDVEMEILVDECREVILGLSSKNEAFTGPFVLEGGLGVEGGNGDDEDGQMAKDVAAAEASAEKLSKLQPLPALLASFDLDTHVGLIQRLLTEDPKLVDMQSRLSSGGERELIFWKNYFFHCAYTRYEVSKISHPVLTLLYDSRQPHIQIPGRSQY